MLLGACGAEELVSVRGKPPGTAQQTGNNDQRQARKSQQGKQTSSSLAETKSQLRLHDGKKVSQKEAEALQRATKTTRCQQHEKKMTRSKTHYVATKPADRVAESMLKIARRDG